MHKFQLIRRQLGQGMTEYIIIVALIAIAAIGVYQAFGDVVRGQTATAAVQLGGGKGAQGRSIADAGSSAANTAAKAKTLKNFEK